MEQRRWKQVESVYHAAREQAPEHRGDYLTAACAGDEELRREVESLLRQDVSSDGGPLDRPAWEGGADSAADPTGPLDRRSSSALSRSQGLSGRTLGHYRIAERLGAGGMGIVYKAEDTVLRRMAALKFLASETFRDDEVKERLIREAQAAASLDHPNICGVHGIHEVDGLTFVAMAYIDGPSLAEKIEESPLEWEQAVEVALAVGDALQEAHDAGIVHRDIKPHNIMLTSKGQVRVMDFGLALVAGRSKITKSGSTVGTPAYMSPEQMLGEAVDHRTDIWALGIVLYEMLAQKTPFEADYEQAVAYGIVNVDPEPVTTLRGDLPAQMDAILAKALAKQTAERYQSIGELSQALRALRTDSTPAAVSGSVSRQAFDLPRVKMSRRAAIAAGGAGALTVVGTGIYYLLSGSGQVESMAILPFELEAPSVEDDALAEGIAEGLIANLARCRDLRVISRDAAFRYEGRDRDAASIASELGVEAVLKGRVVRSGDELLISAELVDASDRSVLWSSPPVRRSEDDLLDLDRTMAAAIADRLALSLGDEQRFEPISAPTLNPDAYRLYLLGRYHWNRRPEMLSQARDSFQRAVRADPGYALAWAGLADVYLMLGGWMLTPPEDSFPRAAQAARRAIELDSSLAEPRATLGYFQVVYERDWPGAKRDFEKAIELDYEYATAHHWYAFYHLTLGDASRALAEMRIAHRFDPLSPVINVELAYFLHFARRYDESEQAARKALEVDGTFGYAYTPLAYSYAMRGRASDARRAVQQCLALSGDSIMAWMFCGVQSAWLGDVERARQMLANLTQHAADNHEVPQLPGMIHAALGENDRAFELFEASIAERSFIASWMRDPLLEKFSKDSRFGPMMASLGLPA